MLPKRKRVLPSWMNQSPTPEKATTVKESNDHVSNLLPAAPVFKKRLVVDNLSNDSDIDDVKLDSFHQKPVQIPVSSCNITHTVPEIDAEDKSCTDSTSSENIVKTTNGANEDSTMSHTKGNNVNRGGISADIAPDIDNTSNDGRTSVSTSRQSCYYGSSCYRKNPQHRIDFAHPGDSEYIDQATTSNDSVDNRPLCQYGAACYRKNPQHRLDYKHDAPKKRAARPTKLQDFPSDNEGDFDASLSSDNYNPSESNDSFVTSDSMDSGNSDFKVDAENPKRKDKKAGRTRDRDNTSRKRKARPTKLMDLSSDKDGDFDASSNSDNYNPGTESDDSSMNSGESDHESNDEGSEKTLKKGKKHQKKRKRMEAK